MAVRRWQSGRHFHNGNQIRGYEDALKVLLSCSVPDGQREQKAFLENKRCLMIELNQMRTMEESIWR